MGYVIKMYDRMGNIAYYNSYFPTKSRRFAAVYSTLEKAEEVRDRYIFDCPTEIIEVKNDKR